MLHHIVMLNNSNHFKIFLNQRFSNRLAKFPCSTISMNKVLNHNSNGLVQVNWSFDLNQCYHSVYFCCFKVENEFVFLLQTTFFLGLV